MNISPSQALLLIIEQVKKQAPLNIIEYNELIHLYLDGVINPDYSALMQRYFNRYKETVLNDFSVDFTQKAISEDPTRRYFETHLCFESLALGLKHVSRSHLEWLEHNIRGALNAIDRRKGASQSRVAPPIEYREGKYYQGHHLIDNQQYYDYLSRIKEPNVESITSLDEDILFNKPPFTRQDRDKVRLIIRCTLLALVWANSRSKSKHLPLDIYNQGLFTQTQRGRLDKADNESTKSQHYGLMKGHMPLSRDDLAMANKPFCFFKPSEKCTYIEGADWVDTNFYRAVHPFSSSISGTALCLIKAMSFFRNIKSTPTKQNKLYLTKSQSEFDHFFRSFIATHLSFSGGHSLFEFSYVLNLPEVAKAFSAKEGVKETDLDLASATISRLFLFDDNQAFENAITKAIAYNNRYLLKQKNHINLLEGEHLIKSSNIASANQLSAKSIGTESTNQYQGSRWIKNVGDDGWSKSKKRKEVEEEESIDGQKVDLDEQIDDDEHLPSPKKSRY